MNRPARLLRVLLAIAVLDVVRGDDPVRGTLHPRLSPDGKEIAASWQGSLITVGIDGGPMRRLTDPEGWDIEPAWSPDGKVVAFLRTANFFTGELMLLDTGTGEVRPLPQTVRGEGNISFSADGKRLFGILSDGPFPTRPAWVDLETGATTFLEIGPEDSSAFRRKRIRFALAPDSDEIYYAIHRDEPNEQSGNRGPESDVWRCQADGSGEKRVFTWPARIHGIAVAPGEGGLIVVTDLGVSHNDLWEIPFRDPLGGARRLTSSFADDDRPSLDATGSRLLWSDNFSGSTELRIRDRESGAESTVHRSKIVFREPTGILELELVDASDDRPVAARVSIRRSGGGNHFPEDALYRLTGDTGHFYADGSTSLELPVGKYEVQVYRGLEYRVARHEIAVTEKFRKLRIPLERWSHMAGEGWYSGENHVHANYGYGEWYNKPESILLQCQGEDLNVCNTVIANSDGDAIYDREFFLGQLDPRSTDRHLVYFGQEFRSTIWGHMTLADLSQLVEPIMTGFPGTTNPYDYPTNGDIAQRVRDQGGTIGYTHPAGNRLDLYDQPYSAKGLPVDAALGRVSLMDVHGHTYEGATQLWYRLMNCGLRIAGSSGTDVFLNRLRSYPPGWARTYVHLPEGLEYDPWIRHQHEGKSFFTNGPMLRFTVEGEPIGSTVRLAEPKSIGVTVSVDSPVPLDRVEIVRNGEVAHSEKVVEGSTKVEFEGEIEIEDSGWVALRAHGPAHPDIIQEANAHTNPVWIEVEGRPNATAPKEAAYFLKWIDRLEGDLARRDRIPTERLWEIVRAQLDGAREYYRGLMAK